MVQGAAVMAVACIICALQVGCVGRSASKNGVREDGQKEERTFEMTSWKVLSAKTPDRGVA